MIPDHLILEDDVAFTREEVGGVLILEIEREIADAPTGANSEYLRGLRKAREIIEDLE